MKSGLKYINKAVLFEVNKLIKEQEEEGKTDDDVLDTFNKMDTFVNDEKEQSDTAVKNSLKLMSALSEPIKRNAENLNMTVQKERIKKLDTMKKNIEVQKKNFEDNIKKKEILAKNQINITNQQNNTQTMPQPSFLSEVVKNVVEKMSLPMLTRTFTEQNDLPVNQNSINPAVDSPKETVYLVKFDKNTQKPFDVKFTERGFSIEGTRLSFEALENALSKNYTITLSNGKGLMLDAIRMQKILKYKNKWFHGL